MLRSLGRRPGLTRPLSTLNYVFWVRDAADGNTATAACDCRRHRRRRRCCCAATLLQPFTLSHVHAPSSLQLALCTARPWSSMSVTLGTLPIAPRVLQLAPPVDTLSCSDLPSRPVLAPMASSAGAASDAPEGEADPAAAAAWHT